MDDIVKIYRRNYILLEVMIALSLVALCALPLVGMPAAAVKAEIKALEEMEISREAEVLFAILKGKLYQGKLPWKDIPLRMCKAKRWNTTISMAPISSKEITLHYQLFFSGKIEKEDKVKNEWGRLCVRLSYTQPGKKDPLYISTHKLAVYHSIPP